MANCGLSNAVTRGAPVEVEMAAYCLGYLSFKDMAFLEDYSPQADKIIADFGGEVMFAGVPTVLEGAAPHDQLAVMIRFPDAEAAKKWYNGPEYAPLLKIRKEHSDAFIAVVENSQ